MACVGQGESTTGREQRRFGRRLVPAVMASALLLTGVAAAGRPGPGLSRTQAGAPMGEVQPVQRPPGTLEVSATPMPTPRLAPVPTPPAVAPTPTAAPTATASPTLTPTPAPRPDLGPLLRELAADLDPDRVGVVSITVIHDGTTSSVGGDESVVSASAAKLYWAVAAAGRADDVSRLEADAAAVFGWSDNEAAGRMIDVVGGVDAVNAYTAGLGLEETSLSAWAYGGSRFASDRADRGNENRTSTGDLARFLDLFASGSLLDLERQPAVETWLRLTPDELASSHGLDALLVDRLPAGVAADSMHKAGWLPAGCCSVIEHVLVAGGVVPLPDGGWFSISVAAQDSPDFDATLDWIPQVACEVYLALGGAEPCRPQT